MTEGREWEDLATSMAHMARDLLYQGSVQETLDRIVTHAVDQVEGCEAAGVLVLRGGRVLTMALTDNVVRASDRLQGELGEGPCFDAAYHKREAFRIADLTSTEHRWPRYVPQARELGVASMMGFLLFTDGEDDLGALDLYSSQPGAFTDLSEHVGWILASHAAVALASARNEAQLHEAIRTRQEIGEALGILMERHGLTEQQAFAALTKASQDHNIKLREIARTISTKGEIPSTR
ncbi:GAF and ANTAR domain-containing protein [Amycolatopsis palatopharyngis]|uniref:GAF and ANTAR domain-containing protein n=1 Tax=Amycolatopsis palatopharyngis TaxID=187982 RepID=UPI000E27D573|nr:GAF and ANTAR domain-containing protein [Amycolatopsis palatopharyngis]